MKRLVLKITLFAIVLSGAKSFASPPPEEAQLLHNAFKAGRTMDAAISLAFGDNVPDADNTSRYLATRMQSCARQQRVGNGATTITREVYGPNCLTDYNWHLEITSPSPEQKNIEASSSTKILFDDVAADLGMNQGNTWVNFTSNDHPDNTWDSTGLTELNINTPTNTVINLKTNNTSQGLKIQRGQRIEAITTHAEIHGIIYYNDKQLEASLVVEAPADGKQAPTSTCSLNNETTDCQNLAYIVGYDTAKQMTASLVQTR